MHVWPAHAWFDWAAARLTKLSMTGATQTAPPTTPVPMITFRREICELEDALFAHIGLVDHVPPLGSGRSEGPRSM